MEDLAYVAIAILATIYGSSILAFGLSWIHKPWANITATTLAALGATTSILLAWNLTPGNGIYIAAIPALMAVGAILNVLRQQRHK